jgi:hypothetical protein
MTPRVHASGGRVRYGRTRPDVNHYLKWAYAEAANVSMMHRSRHPKRHVSALYSRMKSRRGRRERDEGHEPQEVRFVIATRHRNNLLLHGQRRDCSDLPLIAQ